MKKTTETAITKSTKLEEDSNRQKYSGLSGNMFDQSNHQLAKGLANAVKEDNYIE